MTTAPELPVALDAAAAPSPAPALRLVPVEPLDFDDAVRRVQPRLQRYAVRRLGDLHEAEELVQEALLRAYSHRAQLLTEDDLAAWTTVVTGRLVIDRLRVRGRSTPMAEVPEPSRVGRDTADVVVARDEARLALDALDAMPPRQAALLWAREVEGSSYDELCTRFGMSEPAVRSVLTRARKALRKEYAARGGTMPVGGLAVLAPWVAGLTWADKLRRAASRASTPAALSALGISALGGLVLGPFALGTHPDPGRLHAAPAVVTGTASADPTGAVAATRAGLSAPPTLGTTTQRGRQRPTLVEVAHGLTHSCVNDTAPGDGTAVSLPGGLPGDPAVGQSGCGAIHNTSADSLTLNPGLPANPVGAEHLGVSSDYLDCSLVPSSPLYTCTHRPSTSGAQR